MYSYIRGILTEQAEDAIVVEAGGVGYHIYTPAQTFSALPGLGEEVKVYTHLHMREDAMLLYGFLSKEDLIFFKLLIGVSGIGPKGAVAILSVLSTDDLRFAVMGEDAKTIARAPGIGAKTAQRLILELKDKISLADVFEEKPNLGDRQPDVSTAAVKNDAVAALVALGYSSSEAVKALSGIAVTEETTVEDLLKQCLKNMSLV